MSVSEFERHQVFQWLEENMGPERSASLMKLLPPVGWGDIATKTDLDHLGIQLRGEMAGLEGKLDKLDGKIDRLEGRLMRHTYLGVLASNVTVVGLVLAVVRLG